MAQCPKHFHPTPPADLIASPSAQTPAEERQPVCAQPSMRRYIHPVPVRDEPELRSSDRYAALLRATEQQNALLTDLIGAVNGLCALICSRSSS